jgi:phosphoribosylformimino-5-aminoimidazole carboxamide ribonucleotide (ProFAR) isomerase/phosphoribosylaminoimidazole-succinocarboxamide synthase/phosphoribosyl-ATP pyrophosphohydrolase
MKGVIIIVGNDASGKSSLCQIGHSDYLLVERSSNSPYSSLAKEIDRLTLLHQFEDEYKNVNIADQIQGIPLYYVLLDPPISTLEQRLQLRSNRDKWETLKSLKYFKKRFQSIATDFGIPIFDNSNETPDQTISRIVEFVSTRYHKYRQLALLSLTRDQINRNDVEHFLFQNLVLDNFDPIIDPLVYIEGMEHDPILSRKLYIKKLVNDPSRYYIRDNYLYVDDQGPISIPDDIILMRVVVEGESKRIYKLVDSTLLSPDYCIILLKSTIYSHSRQSTGEIGGLANVRAIGTQLMLEMLNRNNIAHSYFSINSEGVIISEWLDDIVPLEIVVKKYCLGTDKHSYYGLASNDEIVNTDFRYASGQYVRFDWRNPNHLVCLNNQRINPVESPYYYTIEDHYGKENFFDKFLRQSHVTPLGDKQISEDVISQSTDTKQLKKLVLRTFMTIQAYLNQIGLEVQDACFMSDRYGSILWSEINQDCMRIVTIGNDDIRYDKDIWRAGGSSSKELLLQKWVQFNDLMMSHLNGNRFDPENFHTYVYHPEILCEHISPEYIDLYHQIYLEDFQHLHGIESNRDIIVTMDLYDGNPVLVQKGIVKEIHSESVNVALDKIRFFPNILMVDLNRAIPGASSSINRSIIKQIALSHYIYTGGGIKTLDDAKELLGSSVRRVVVGSNFDQKFLTTIPSNRLIIELTVNENNEVLTHGRTVNTQISIRDYIQTLVQYQLDTFSITFHSSEGLLQGIPRDQIRKLMIGLPWNAINKIIIAGGISSLDDLEFLWSFPKVVPQVGSMIWKNKVSVGHIYSGLLKFRHQIPTVIQSKIGMILEVLTIDHATLISILNQQSYQGFKIEKIEVNQNHLVILIDHVGIIRQNSIVKTNLLSLVEFLKSKQSDSGSIYSIQQEPELVLTKILDEFQKLLCSDSTDVVDKSAELMIHLLMYINSKDIRLEDILNQLNAQRWNLDVNREMPVTDTIKVGITGSKYSPKTDQFVQKHLGIVIKRPAGRGLKIDYDIVDLEHYQRYFGTSHLNFIPCRPKDMVAMMAKNEIQMAVTYSTVMDNQPQICKLMTSEVDPSIKLCLIRRKGEEIDYSRNIQIACEHPRSCSRYFKNRGIDNVFLHYVTGQSESFMVNSSSYDLCDAIVESGSTLIENELEIHDIIHDNGEVMIGLYARGT